MTRNGHEPSSTRGWGVVGDPGMEVGLWSGVGWFVGGVKTAL